MDELSPDPLIGSRTDNGFRGANRALVPQLLDVIEGLRDYWPMSLRQIYYQAVANRLVPNDQNQYRRIMRLCKTLREDDLLPWHAMEDRARRTTGKRGLSGLDEFLEANLESMLSWRYYQRCHLQGQDAYVEVTIEKDALAPLVEEVCWPLCTRMSVTKGQPSVTLMQQIASRMEAAMQRGQSPMLLHFGDLDPTGIQIPLSMRKTLFDVHGLDVEVVAGGLTPAQVEEHDLPHSIEAAKADDPNYQRWLDRHGDLMPVELDAMHPSILQDTVREALLGCYDDDLMREQQEREQEDRNQLKIMRWKTLKFLRETFPDEMAGLEHLR